MELLKEIKNKKKVDREWLRSKGVANVNDMVNLHSMLEEVGVELDLRDAGEWDVVIKPLEL